MASGATRNPLKWITGKLTDAAIGLLTKPLKSYELHIANDIVALRRHVHPGDVILVEGNERISQCIKYLTQSSWSHSAIYIGDAYLRRHPEKKAELHKEFGEDAAHLLVEALVDQGVILAPMSKYRNFNLRVCRPFRLSSADGAEVIDEALRSVGDTYDVRNVVDLARYFLPVSLVPARLRRKALQFGSGEPTRVICSSLIAGCFARVRFPIIPKYEQTPEGEPIAVTKVRKLWPIGSKATQHQALGRLRMVSPTLVTPRDFDLSPYFEIIKFNIIESMRFDYRKIQWADDQPSAEVKKGA
ncbi:MAG TPA: YiiX/YebB-like N1pC/P60 family cysteine hydrolase [Candidatus Binataceae bacterium]|nr:YiiX/YebB-like N1pC/P60 family cysteine hydrolase [Candidatus Binataceae bacterium]